MPQLQDVFVLNGVPTHTFVEPPEFPRLRINLRSRGRGLVVEGPSGIGKTTAIERAIEQEGLKDRVTKLSARKKEDLEYIENIYDLVDSGVIVIDDFHKIPFEKQKSIADFVKVLADEGNEKLKVIIVGINDSGRRLIEIADDITNRIDVVPMENNPNEKIRELIDLGERALDITISVSEEIVFMSNGSFYLAQMLCHEACLKDDVLETMSPHKTVDISAESVKSSVWRRLNDRFYGLAKTFCEGVRRRKEGRAPYLHLLKWLSESDSWVLNIRDACNSHPEMKGSVSQVIDKDYLSQLFKDNKNLEKQIHYDESGKKLIIEDPQFVFYIRNIAWSSFALDLGFNDVFQRKYDFALSFAGSVRQIAESIFYNLSDREMQIFYDRQEQHRILSNDLEDYLHPIYNSEARYVICIIDENYPKRIWTRFEEKVISQRSHQDIIIILVGDTDPGAFSSVKDRGYLQISAEPDETEIDENCSILVRRLHENT